VVQKNIIFKTTKFLTGIFLFLFFSSAFATTVTVSSNTSWSAGANAGADVVVNSGAILTLAPGSYSWNSLTLTSGTVTHTTSSSGITLTIATDVSIDSSSYLKADGVGYAGGSTSGAGSGSSPGLSTGYGGGGGGHGGAGGAGASATGGSALYGSPTQPIVGGSGGGGSGATAGGAGGGVIKLIVTGTVTVSGTLSANGAAGPLSGSYSGGSGAGGALWIQAGTLAGAGTISANGGTSPSATFRGGGGGGGRVAIYYTTNTFSGTISMAGGTGYSNGVNGSYVAMDSSKNFNCNTAITSYYDPSYIPSGGINDINITNGCVLYLLNGTVLTSTGSVTVGSSSTLGTYSTGTVNTTNATTQPTTANNLGAMKLSIAGTLTVTGMLSANNAMWIQAASLAGAGSITAPAIAIYYSSNTFSGTVTDTGSFFFQNYGTGDISCPFGITTYFSPADSIPSYSLAINNVDISGSCKYGFKSGSTGTAAALTVPGNLTVAASSYFWAEGYGSAGGSTSSIGSGSSPGLGSGSGGGGGAHAGLGGAGSALGGSSTYGSATQPITLGSGGGGSGASYGGAGGGAIKLIVTGTTTVNGTISANGAAGPSASNYAGGGGAGGSIWIQTGILDGSGTISATGGSSPSVTFRGGGGGGGRIAIYYTTNTFSGTISTNGGGGLNAGGNGTYFAMDGNKNLICNSSTTSYYDPSSPPSGGINDVNITNGCNFYLLNGSTMTIAGNVNVGSGSTFGTYGTGTVNSTNATTQPTTSNNLGAMKLSVAGTITVTGTLSATNAMWIQTATLAGAGAITAPAIAVYYSSNTFSGTVTDTGSFFLQNYGTGNISCPYAITTYFNPADSIPSYSLAINNVDISGSCKYGFKSGSTGTAAALTVPGNLTVAASSYFWAEGYGSAGGAISTIGSGSSPGVGGSSGGGGGAHAGAGGAGAGAAGGSSSYGSATQPITLGSGGGGSGASYGGAGGGAIKLIVTGTTTINGTISANGAAGLVSGSYSGGSGAGGSIWIQTGTLDGTGSITANGGTSPAGTFRGGGGGGGRVAIYYTTNTFSGTISVTAGVGYASGGNGTYFAMDGNNNLNCNSSTTSYYDPSSPPSGGINDVNITNGCNFYLLNGSTMTIAGNVNVGSGSIFGTYSTGTVNSTNATTQPTTANNLGAMKLSVAGTITVTGTLSATNVMWIQTATLAGAGSITAPAIAIYYSSNTFSGTVTDTGSFFLQNYGTGDISCPYAITTYFNPADSIPSYSLAINNVDISGSCKYGFKLGATGTAAALTVAGNLTVAASSYFWAEGYGSAGGSLSSTGSGSSPGVGTSSAGGGAGHASAGGNGYSTAYGGSSTYGSVNQPVTLGSGGGGSTGNYGGYGGGAVKLIVSGTTTVNGSISANGGAGGSSGSYSSGGGSGGSIWIQTGTLAGSGSITANGGTSPSVTFRGGGGSGGRIALYYTTKTFSGTVTATGGAGNVAGGAGTVSGLYAATKLVFSTQPSTTGTVGTNLAQQPIVQAQDGTYSTLDTNYATSVTLAAYTDATCTTAFTGSTVAGSPNTPTGGLSTFSGVNVNKYNSGAAIYLKATSGALTSACSTAVTLSVGSASVLVFTTQPSTSNTAGVIFATQPVVKAQDGYNNTVTSYVTSVALALYTDASCTSAATGGTLSGTPMTPVSGVATFTGVKHTKSGSYYFKATSGALTSACSQTFDVVAGPSAQLVYSVSPSLGAAAGVDLAVQPTVTLQDSYGNTTSDTGSSVTLLAYTDSGCTAAATGGTLNGMATTTAGSAPFSGVNYTKVGTIYLKSTVSGFSACSTSVAISPGTAAKLAFTTQPSSSGQPAVNLATQPVVAIQDTYGNTVTTDTSSVTLAPYLNATCASLASGTLNQSETTTAGLANFSGVNYSKGETIYLKATSGALSTACSTAVNMSSVRMFFRGF
jgi:hypothetical protein